MHTKAGPCGIKKCTTNAVTTSLASCDANKIINESKARFGKKAFCLSIGASKICKTGEIGLCLG